jgi:hypothetical protein
VRHPGGDVQGDRDVGTPPSAAAVTVTSAGSGCAEASSRSRRRCSLTSMPTGRLTGAGSRRGSLSARCSRRISLRLESARQHPRRARPCQSAAEFPAVWRATFSLAARQVTRRHQIMVIRATGPGAPKVLMVLTPGDRGLEQEQGVRRGRRPARRHRRCGGSRHAVPGPGRRAARRGCARGLGTRAGRGQRVARDPAPGSARPCGSGGPPGGRTRPGWRCSKRRSR